MRRPAPQQAALLCLYQQRAAANDRMPTLREAGALLGISHIRVRQLNVKLSAIGAIELQTGTHRGVRVANARE